MALPWRVKGLALRAQSLHRRYTPMDGLMILTAFADLRIRGPEVQSVCFKSCVALASAQEASSLRPYMIVEALAALASLQARRIPLIRRVLAPRLVELQSNTNPKTLQRAALALGKLGHDQVPVSVAAHVLSLMLEAILHHPTDSALVIGACALLPLSTPRNNSTSCEDVLGPTTATVVAACTESSRDHCIQQLVAARERWLATSDQDGWVLAPQDACTIALWLARTCVQRGIHNQATGNAVFQLLYLLPPLAAMHVALARVAQQTPIATPADGAANAVAVHDAQASIVAFVQGLNIGACVPGGYATFMQGNLSDLVALLPSSMPFVRRLMLAATDRTFARAFNAYDVAKLADAVREAPWEPSNLSLPSVVSINASSSSSSSVFTDVLLAVSDRLVAHLEFFAQHVVSPAGGYNGVQRQQHHYQPTRQLDGVVFCSVLRCLLRLAAVPGSASSWRNSGAFVHALQGMMARVCRAFVLSIDDVGNRWAAASIPWALLTVSRVLHHLSKVVPQAAPHDGARRSDAAATVAAAAMRLAAALTEHHKQRPTSSLKNNATATMAVREAVQALYCAAALHTTLEFLSAAVVTAMPPVAAAVVYSEADVRTLLTLCSTSLDNGTWCDAVATDWGNLPRTEWAMLVRSLGGGLGALVSAAQQRCADSGASTRIATQVGRLATSFLQHAATTDLPTATATPSAGQNAKARGGDRHVNDGNEPLHYIDALVAAITWMGSSSVACGSSGAASAVRIMFRKLLALPPHSLPSSAMVQLLDALTANRHVVFAARSAATDGGVVAAAVLLRSDVRVFWLRQRHLPDWVGRSHGTTATTTTDGHAMVRGGLTRHGVVTLCRSAACLRVLGFTLIPEDVWDDPYATDAEPQSSSRRQRSARDAAKAADKRRLPLPLPSMNVRQSATADGALRLTDAVLLAKHVEDQRERLLQRDWDAWVRALAPCVSRSVSQASLEEATALVQALRSPDGRMLLLPQDADLWLLLNRCDAMVGDTGKEGGDLPEVADLVQAFRGAPHLLERLSADAPLHKLVFP